MALERKWLAIAPRAFTANGTTTGIVTVDSTSGFRIKQTVYLQGTTLPQKEYQVKYVISKTQLVVGPNDNTIGRNKGSNISSFTVSLNAEIGANIQDKNNIPDKDHYSAVYESDPVVADRVILVDEFGDIFGEGNPLPIEFDGTISVGKVQVEGENGNTIEPNVDGSINVNIVQAPSNNQIKNTYAEASAVPSGVETVIVQYVVSLVLTQALLQRISVSGENVARYQVFINNVVVDTRRTYYGGSFNEYFEFAMSSGDGYVLQPGDIVAVKVLHDRPSSGNFQSRIQALEIN